MRTPRRSGWLVLLVLGLLALGAPTAGATPRSGHQSRTAWSRACRVARAAPSARIGRCTSPRAPPAGSPGSIPRPEPPRLRQRSAELIPEVGFGGPVDVAFLGRTA